MARGRKREGATIVLKRIEGEGHGHHGGAWKVAYADFVTAMMAFFLLMWLLGATTEEQRRGLADYFNPSVPMSSGASGLRLPFGGATPNSVGRLSRDEAAVRIETGNRPTNPDLADLDTEEPEEAPTLPRQGPPGQELQPQAMVARSWPGAAQGEHRPAGRPRLRPGEEGEELRDSEAARLTDLALRAELARREQAALEEAAAMLREAIARDPATASLASQVVIEVRPEGLRIQLLDSDGQPMFALGSAEPLPRIRALIRAVAVAAERLPNPISITGHTDAAPFRGPQRSNWELSAERANAARRLLLEAGVAEGRIHSVSGVADRELHLPDAPLAAANRRVAITLLRQADVPRGR
ncbi:MAG: flagellar motor protein MotB [Rhodovarius sp.]|nr:OmpA family protein [Rhodovarius sp.]MDW8315579.1 flagellar motor protein MotB [Rhodovarius sp.]